MANPPREHDRPAPGRDLLSLRDAEGQRAGREQALQAALHGLVPSWHQDYPDSPDRVVTSR